MISTDLGFADEHPDTPGAMARHLPLVTQGAKVGNMQLLALTIRARYVPEPDGTTQGDAIKQYAELIRQQRARGP